MTTPTSSSEAETAVPSPKNAPPVDETLQIALARAERAEASLERLAHGVRMLTRQLQCADQLLQGQEDVVETEALHLSEELIDSSSSSWYTGIEGEDDPSRARTWSNSTNCSRSTITTHEPPQEEDFLKLSQELADGQNAARVLHHHARLVCQEASESVQAQVQLQMWKERANTLQTENKELRQNNQHMQGQVEKLSMERRILVREVKSLRNTMATVERNELWDQLEQYVTSALTFHEQHLKTKTAMDCSSDLDDQGEPSQTYTEHSDNDDNNIDNQESTKGQTEPENIVEETKESSRSAQTVSVYTRPSLGFGGNIACGLAAYKQRHWTKEKKIVSEDKPTAPEKAPESRPVDQESKEYKPIRFEAEDSSEKNTKANDTSSKESSAMPHEGLASKVMGFFGGQSTPVAPTSASHPSNKHLSSQVNRTAPDIGKECQQDQLCQNRRLSIDVPSTSLMIPQQVHFPSAVSTSSSITAPLSPSPAPMPLVEIKCEHDVIRSLALPPCHDDEPK